MHPVVDSYLTLIDTQCEELFSRLEGAPPERIWERPAPKKWSPGQQLDHTRLFNRTVTWLLRLASPVIVPVARFRQHRSYETDIDDVYLRPNMPKKVGVLWSPRHSRERPISLVKLHDTLACEHLRIRRWYEGKEERLLGNAYVWDPLIGRLNLIQVLRVVAYHDEHHYKIAEHILDT